MYAELSLSLTEEEGTTYEKCLADLTAEHNKPSPSVAKIKRLMKSTFTGRRAWILQDTPTVCSVINVFPALKSSARVSTTCNICYVTGSSILHCFMFVGSQGANSHYRGR